MDTTHFLFWFAVFGNLVLLYYAFRAAFLAIRLYRNGDKAGALWKASAACVLAGLAILFPWALIAGESGVAKIALLICLFTPFVAISKKVRNPVPSIVGVLAFLALVGDWVSFWKFLLFFVVLTVLLVLYLWAAMRKPDKIERRAKWEPDDDVDFYHGDMDQYRL